MTDITKLAHLRAELSNTTIGNKEQLRKIALSLVNELEKTLWTLDKIKSSTRHVDTSEEAFIPNSLDAWGRPVPQYLPYDFSGNPGASATQYCNGWNDAGGYWMNYVRELESRSVTVSKSDIFNVPGGETYVGGEMISVDTLRLYLAENDIKWEVE